MDGTLSEISSEDSELDFFESLKKKISDRKRELEKESRRNQNGEFNWFYINFVIILVSYLSNDSHTEHGKENRRHDARKRKAKSGSSRRNSMFSKRKKKRLRLVDTNDSTNDSINC